MSQITNNISATVRSYQEAGQRENAKRISEGLPTRQQEANAKRKEIEALEEKIGFVEYTARGPKTYYPSDAGKFVPSRHFYYVFNNAQADVPEHEADDLIAMGVIYEN